MGHWLARARTVQAEDVLTRFDPRYWTVNFPRPMMAAVTTIGPDALRVDCVFYRRDDLAGLIWEAEDRVDHPLLRYETRRDFRDCRLGFRWRSAGVRALDVPPADPAAGASWIVGAAPTGAWSGRAHALATWTAGGWRFVRPREGMAVWDGQALVPVRFVGGAWERGVGRATRLIIAGEQVVGARSGPIAEPAGGGVADAEARATLGAILAALRGHGLIAD